MDCLVKVKLSALGDSVITLMESFQGLIASS